MIPDEFIRQLKAANPIEEVMGASIPLKRSSRDYVCLCPFHSEKTPSCHVSTGRQFFHCFGCGAGGDVITFVMKYENLEYIEALKYLAQRAGMVLPDDAANSDMARLKSRILEMNRKAAQFYNHILTSSPMGEKGRLYFSSRQLMPQTISKYGLGYAPDSWSALTDHLRSEGFRDDEIVSANLARRSTKGGVYDSFRDRAMFPIIDLRGNVIAFGGRIIDGEGPKYLNSSDTPVFRKSRNLFSLNFAKRSDERRLILAEGYMDVITINQAGFENVVATLGTALTPEQARIMSQYADEVIISYDSDGAGQKAAMRAINLLSETGLRTRVLKIEGAKDPDEYIKKFGSARFRHLLDKSEGAVNFELQKCADGLDITSDTGKVEYLKRAAQVIAEIASPVEREVYISRVAEDQNISAAAVQTQVALLRRKKQKSVTEKQWQSTRTFENRRREDPFAAADAGAFRAEKGVISYLSRHPDEYENVRQTVTADDFVTELNKKIFTLYMDQLSSGDNTDIMSVQGGLTADEMGRVAQIVSEAEELAPDRRAFDDYVSVLKKYADKARQKPASQMTDNDLVELQKKLRTVKK